MIDLDDVGAHATTDADGRSSARFGLYLPGIVPADGYRVVVRVVHRDDRFAPGITPQDTALEWVAGSANDLWTATVPIEPPGAASAATAGRFGQPGTYLYYFQLFQGAGKTPLVEWFTDPFARDTDIGELSAVMVPADGPDAFAWSDAGFRVPEIHDCIVYELQVEEFNGTFDGVIERLDYLEGLGVNVLELMPVTSLKLDFDWGYGPLHYFAPNARCGGAAGLKRLVNACHARGMAVILDVVYQHVAYEFAYNLLYGAAGKPSPMIGASGAYGPQADFSQAFTRNYFLTANYYWLDTYHVDGFRYDNVDGYYDGPTGVAFAELAFRTYQYAQPMARFRGDAPGAPCRLIQCAEALSQPQTILRDTYATAAWQNGLLDKAEDMAANGYVDDAFARLLDTGLSGYPAQNSIPAPAAPFQYLESHDHSRLITYCGLVADDVPGDVRFGDRGLYYQLQPFAIALYTCEGVPMLWQGQEFAENYTLPPAGTARVAFRRDVHWEHFYDAPGQALIRLYRILARLRRTCPALRSRDSYYESELHTTGQGVVVYHRHAAATATAAEQMAVVCLNFSGAARQISVPFRLAGTYREMLDDDVRSASGAGSLDIVVANAGEQHEVSVPSHYGCVFVTT